MYDIRKIVIDQCFRILNLSEAFYLEKSLNWCIYPRIWSKKGYSYGNMGRKGNVHIANTMIYNF